jgi:hypothetical protein
MVKRIASAMKNDPNLDQLILDVLAENQTGKGLSSYEVALAVQEERIVTGPTSGRTRARRRVGVTRAEKLAVQDRLFELSIGGDRGCVRLDEDQWLGAWPSWHGAVTAAAEVVEPQIFDQPMAFTFDLGATVLVANGGRLILEHRDGVLQISLGFGREVRVVGEASTQLSAGGVMNIRAVLCPPKQIEMEEP